jgi:hypothetical protein
MLHPIIVGTALLAGAALLTWARRVLTPPGTWAALPYSNRYSLLVSIAGLSVGYFAIATVDSWSAFGLPDVGKWAGVFLWILAGVMSGIGGVMLLIVYLSNRLSRTS